MALSVMIFSHIRRKQFNEFWSTNEKMTPTFDLWLWNSIGFMRLSTYMFMQNTTEWSGLWVNVHTNLPYIAMVKNLKIRSCDLDLWPMTLKFSGFWVVVEMHVPANCHQAEFMSYHASREKLPTKTIQSVATAWAAITVPDDFSRSSWLRLLIYNVPEQHNIINKFH